MLASVALGGGYNGFSGTASFGGGPSYAISTNPYEWTWAGFYYLTNNTAFLTNGTTNINPCVARAVEDKKRPRFP